MNKKPSERIAEIKKALMLFNNEDVVEGEKDRSYYDVEAIIKYPDEWWSLGSDNETKEDTLSI